MSSWDLVSPEIESKDVIIACFECDGRALEVIADITIEGRTATLLGCHLQGDGANTLSAGRLRALAAWAKEYFDVDRRHIVGAARTSGARPGRHPRPLVF